MRASERARAREREVGGHRRSRLTSPSYAAGAPSAPRRTARPSAFAAVARARLSFFPCGSEKKRRTGGLPANEMSGRCGFALRPLWRPQLQPATRRAPTSFWAPFISRY